MDFNKTEDIGTTKQVVNHAFPPIIVTGSFATGTGTLEAGTPVAINPTGLYVELDLEAQDSSADAIGVLVKDLDLTGTELVGPVIRLGLVHIDALTDTSADVITALADRCIFAS